MRDSARRCIEMLFDAAADVDGAVRSETVSALRSMAHKDTPGVLRLGCNWFVNNKSTSTSPGQRYVILKAMVAIVNEQPCLLKPENAPLRKSLIECGINEMIAISDLTSEWSHEGALLVVGMCNVNASEGLVALQGIMQTNTLPHFFTLTSFYLFAERSPRKFVAHAKDVLAKLLPLIGLAKQDNHRMLFAHSLGSIAGAVIAVNTPEAEDFSEDEVAHQQAMMAMAQYPRQDFTDVMYSAIQFLTGEYSRSGEVRVRTAVTFALGCLFALCDGEKRLALLPSVLNLVLTGVKREKTRDLLLPARGFTAMLAFVEPELMEAMAPSRDAIFATLLRALTMMEADGSAEAESIKDTLLCAAENICLFDIDGLVTSVSNVLDPKTGAKDAPSRATAVRIVQHLLSKKRCEKRLGSYKDSVVATLKLAMNDPDWGIRRAVVLCIVNMGNSSIDFFHAVGGADLLTYVVRNAAVPDSTIDEWMASHRGGGGSGATPIDLRDFCRNTLISMCSSGSRLDECLWPFILEHLGDYRANPTLVNAFSTVCSCLVQLGNRVAQTERYYIDFSKCVNVPRPPALAIVFLSQVAQQGHYRPDELLTTLEAMSTIAAVIDDPFGQTSGADVTTPIGELWLAVVPELQGKLSTDGGQTFDAWEETISKVVSKTIAAKQSEAWSMEFVQACIAILPAFQQRPKMFRSTILFAGIGLSQTSKKDFVAEMLDKIVGMCNHDDADHRIGASKAFGYVASKHTDAVLEVLQCLSKSAPKKSFFGSSGQKGRFELVDNSKSLAALGFGYACRRMPRDILGSRLDTVILPSFMSIIQEGCVSEAKKSVYEACTIMEAPIAKQQSGYNFKLRDNLIIALINSLGLGGGASSQSSGGNASTFQPSPLLLTLVSTAFHGCASLLRCTSSPSVSSSARDGVVTAVLRCIARSGWTESAKLTDAGSDVLRSLLLHDTPPNLEALLAKVLPRTASTVESERLSAVHFVSVLAESTVSELQRLLSGAEAEVSALREGVQMHFVIGPLIARLIPRFLDTNVEIRMLAGDALVSSLRLLEMKHADMVKANEVNVDAAVMEIQALKRRAGEFVRDGTASCEKELSAITKAVCVAVVGVMPDADVFTPVLETLLDNGLMDPQDDAASCSCVALHGMIRGLGGLLKEKDAKVVFTSLLSALDSVGARELSRNGVLVSIRNLCKHHTVLCFNSILSIPVPYAANTVAALQSIARDRSLSVNLVQHILDTVLNSQLTTDAPVAPQARPGHDASPLAKVLVAAPLAAACCIGPIAEVDFGAAACEQNRASVLMTLLVYLSVAHEFGTPSQISLVADSLRRTIAAICEEVTVDRLERYGVQRFESSAELGKITQELTKYLAREGFEDSTEGDRGRSFSLQSGGLDLEPAAPTAFTSEIAQFTLPYCNHPMRSYRKAALNVCAMLLRYALGDTQLLQSLVTSLLSRTGDNEDPSVRADVLEGLRFILAHPYEDACTFISPILSSLLANMSDTHVAPGVMSLTTLSALIRGLTNKSLLSPTLVNLVVKLRAIFESREAVIRKNAFSTLGDLYVLGNKAELDSVSVNQQVYTNLVPLLLHCEDPDVQVRLATKTTLHEALKFVANSKSDAQTKILQLLSKPHVQPSATMRFDEFMDDFSVIWTTFFIGRVKDTLMEASAYFNSDVEELRGATATLFGQLLMHVPPEELTRCNVDMASAQLTQQLNPSREKSPVVRRKVAEAIGRMSDL